MKQPMKALHQWFYRPLESIFCREAYVINDLTSCLWYEPVGSSEIYWPFTISLPVEQFAKATTRLSITLEDLQIKPAKTWTGPAPMLMQPLLAQKSSKQPVQMRTHTTLMIIRHWRLVPTALITIWFSVHEGLACSQRRLLLTSNSVLYQFEMAFLIQCLEYACMLHASWSSMRAHWQWVTLPMIWMIK